MRKEFARDIVEEAQERTGWIDNTSLGVLCDYIDSKGLALDLFEYLQEREAEEAEMSVDDEA